MTTEEIEKLKEELKQKEEEIELRKTKLQLNEKVRIIDRMEKREIHSIGRDFLRGAGMFAKGISKATSVGAKIAMEAGKNYDATQQPKKAKAKGSQKKQK